ncbi:MAG: hypothetical protein Q9163_001366 [Psora crenata]
MPAAMGKGKPKGKEGRQSRSRNTTPSSSVSAPLTSTLPSHTPLLELPLSTLEIPTNISYDSVLERHGGGGGIPDPNHLVTISNDLKTLAALANTRSDANTKGMRELSERRKQVFEREREREREQTARDRAEEERKSLKREADDEEEERERRIGKLKKKKERSTAREERPLNHGAHGLARQDGLNLPLDENEQIQLQAMRQYLANGLSPGRAHRLMSRDFGKDYYKGNASDVHPASSSTAIKASTSPKRKVESFRASSSPLSEASPTASPSASVLPPGPTSARAPSADSSSSTDSHQPPPAAAQPQYQTFGTNPLTFDDPTIYDIRPVTDDMTDDEKKEIYCVASFPKDDLHDLVAGTPPNKDFSNAVKPNNQVQAHTFASYLDGYLRPLKEEDIGFLNERGDRVTPFLMPPRGKRHYIEIWAEEDGSMASDMPKQDRLPPNQPRGSLEDMDDDVAETDQVSSGPLLSRLLSTMRFEHRPPLGEDKPQANGIPNGTSEPTLVNGDVPNGTKHEVDLPQESSNGNKPALIASATTLPEISRPSANTPQPSHAQMDERLKAELRHIGFLSAEDEPDYDAHLDDEVAERLRWLQERLRRVSVLNGARKRRVLELAEEQLAYQEYSTILEDLDSQVQQAYLKRARTAGKSKKNAKRPGVASGGSQVTPGGVSITNGAVSKPGIGDVARQLMNRRARWEEKIGPVFRGDIRRVRGKGEGIFGEKELEPLLRLEREMFDEEGDGF